MRSGAGLSYEGGDLKLDNYNGREITASGDLYIYTYGTSTVQGKSGVIGANGIAVSGDLDISVRSGSLSVYGGGGTRYGGDAIYTANTFYCFSYGGTAHFAGGNARNGEGGGHGISAGTVHALGSSNSGTRLTATGGAASLYDQGASGGCGILAAVVYVSADAIIRGGDGNVAAPAIFFHHGCEIGCANVELYGGKYSTGSYAKPIQFSPSSDQTWYYHPHTTANAYGGHYSITVNRYRLTLVGNGGWYGGATFTDLIDYYPSYPHAGEHGDCKNAVSQSALHRDLASAEGGHPRGEPRGSEHRDAVHPVPAQVQARRPDQSAAPQAQRVRRRYRGVQARQKQY